MEKGQLFMKQSADGEGEYNPSDDSESEDSGETFENSLAETSTENPQNEQPQEISQRPTSEIDIESSDEEKTDRPSARRLRERVVRNAEESRGSAGEKRKRVRYEMEDDSEPSKVDKADRVESTIDEKTKNSDITENEEKVEQTEKVDGVNVKDNVNRNNKTEKTNRVHFMEKIEKIETEIEDKTEKTESMNKLERVDMKDMKDMTDMTDKDKNDKLTEEEEREIVLRRSLASLNSELVCVEYCNSLKLVANLLTPQHTTNTHIIETVLVQEACDFKHKAERSKDSEVFCTLFLKSVLYYASSLFFNFKIYGKRNLAANYGRFFNGVATTITKSNFRKEATLCHQLAGVMFLHALENDSTTSSNVKEKTRMNSHRKISLFQDACDTGVQCKLLEQQKEKEKTKESNEKMLVIEKLCVVKNELTKSLRISSLFDCIYK